MPQLDRFLAVLVSNRADALLLAEGEVARLEIGGTPRPISKQALTGPQVVMLLREIAPPDAARQLESAQPAAFHYVTADGAFVARAAVRDGKWSASVALEVNGAALGGAETLQALGSAAFDAASLLGTSGGPGGTSPRPTPNGNRGVHAAHGNGNGHAAPAARPTGLGTPTRGVAPVAAVGNDRARVEIERLLTVLVERSGSDLHLRCGEPPIIRQDGEMQRIEGMPVLEAEPLELMLRAIMPERNRKEFAEFNDTDFAHEIDGLARFRGNALRDRKGPAGVFRVIPATVVTVDQLGISPEVQNLCYLTKGLVLVTGPTGSGKSTTLCSLIDLVNRKRADHIITIEDPIEFVHPNKQCIVTQRQVGVHTSSFKHALRAALREDPDIILVGELRDLETVSIAIETAETGHLVFGTLHTTTAASTIDRIIDQFPADRQSQIRVMLSESLRGVISQTLCKKKGGGRVAAREILLTIPAISNLIREGKTFQIPSILQTSRKVGMVTLNDALLELVDGGQVDPKEAYMKSVEKQGMLAQLKQRGHDTSFLDGEPAAAGAAKEKASAPAGARPAAKR